MSDDLDIRSGGVIAVDTESLRAASARLTLLAADGDLLARRLADAAAVLEEVGYWIAVPKGEADAAAERAASLASALRSVAETYEMVELWIRVEVAESAGDVDRAAVLRALSAHTAVMHPDAAARAAAAIAGWVVGRRAGLVGQWLEAPDPTGFLAPGWALLRVGGAVGGALMWAGTAAVDGVGRGAVDGTPLRGGARPVEVRPLTSAPAAAPGGFADMAARIPSGDGRVRVERYTMADGTTQFVAYVAGTRVGGDDDEPWDMASNVELYTGARSTSYDATMAALAAAGAQPGDAVSLVGHSQGAMIASHVAASGVYEVPALVTLGDPVQVAVGAGTLSIDIRHRDDPVPALAAGGHAGAVGSADSIVVERSSPASVLDGEMPMEPHALTRYVETAALLDASSDPRVAPARALAASLGQAVSVQSTVYGASRRG